MDKELLLRWLDGMREVNRITAAEEVGRTFDERWTHRSQIQAMLSLMHISPLKTSKSHAVVGR